MRRALGWNPPDESVIARLRYAGPQASEYLSGVEVAPEVDLSSLVVIQDQGGLGSCVSQAGFQAIHAGMPGGSEFPSRLFGYQLALAAQGTEGKDVGTNLATFFDAVADRGFPRERHWPYDEAALAQRPSPTAWYYAHDQRTEKSIDYHRIVGADVEGQIQQALTAGHLVVFGTQVAESFFDDRGTEPIPPPQIGKTVGGHAMTICGYHDDDGSTIYRVANSWGSGWGDVGFCWFSSDYVMSPLSSDFWFVSNVPGYSDEVIT